MSRLTLTLRAPLTERLDMARLTAALSGARSAYDLEQLALTDGRNRVCLGDAFTVSGTAGSGETVIAGGSDRLDGIGAGLTAGAIRVDGDVGAGVGRDMRGGGRIDIHGSAGGQLASGMKGGLIHVTGSAGDGTGGIAPGRRFGMTGGTVVIDGNAGARTGDRMRRGLILVRGRTGSATGSRMCGGTIIAEGGLGAGPGPLMRRGTLIGPKTDGLLATFADCGNHDLVILKVMARAWMRELGALAPKPIPASVRRFAGDLAALGTGEVLLTAA
jgi:formylmethanofuran dehydrogenase subunit C